MKLFSSFLATFLVLSLIGNSVQAFDGQGLNGQTQNMQQNVQRNTQGQVPNINMPPMPPVHTDTQDFKINEQIQNTQQNIQKNNPPIPELKMPPMPPVNTSQQTNKLPEQLQQLLEQQKAQMDQKKEYLEKQGSSEGREKEYPVPVRKGNEAVKNQSSESESACAEDFAPVCGEIQVQCIKAPCPPIKHTFPNTCIAEQKGALNIVEGKCLDGQKPQNAETDTQGKMGGNLDAQMIQKIKKEAGLNDEADTMSQDRETKQSMQVSAENFDPDMNHDGNVDDFESKVADCLKENTMNMPLCQKQVKQAMMQSFTQGNAQNIDPTSLNYVTPQQIDPSVFQKQNKGFFQKMDPNILNKMDSSKIPDNALQNIDPTKFQNIDPELLKKMQQLMPEQAKMIPENVRKSAELMMDTIPEDLLKQYGFEGDQAEKVKQLMQAVNKQNREKVMQSMDNVSSENRNQMMQHQNQFGNQVGDFMEYLPFVPEKLQDQYLQAKNNVLDSANKLKEAAGTLGQKLQKDVDSFATEVSSYNFSGTTAEELKQQIDDFVATIPTLSEAEAKEKLKEFHNQLGALKEEARQSKFTQGIIPFKDTDDDQWYTSFVSEAVQGGAISGYKNAQGQSLGEFRPVNKVTVTEAVKMALASAGVAESAEEPENTQAKSHWGKGWIRSAEDQGLSLENVDDINRPATRAEVVQWVLESYGVTPPQATTSSFSDVVTGYPGLDYIEYAKANGIISGDGDTGKFRPNDTIIRAEVAKILKAAKEAFGK